MKNVIRILGIVIVLLLIAQLAVMFLPYFDFTNEVKPTKKNPDPQSQFSLQEYVWIHTDKRDRSSAKFKTVDMGEDFFEDIIDNYNINENAEGLALTFVIGFVVVLLNLLNFTNSFRKFITFRTGFIKVVTHIISSFWCYIALSTYLTVPVLTVPQANEQLYMISSILIYVATGLIALHLIVDLVTSIVSGNKARAALRAARLAG